MNARLLLIFLLLAGCSGERINPPPGPGERHALSFEWHIVSQEELRRKFREAGGELPDGKELQGFTGPRGDGRPVVYTLPPERLDDQATCTLGHEILHITHGDYHR